MWSVSLLIFTIKSNRMVSLLIQKIANNPIDINILFNYIWSVTQMHEGEAWTPVCLPGCSEEFMLHVYTYFYNENLGMVLVCTEHEAEYFLECNEYKTEVFEWL